MWWLSPRLVILYLCLPTLLVAYLVPEDSYLVLYETPKYVDIGFITACVAIYLGFVAGSFFVIEVGSQHQSREVVRYCRWVVRPLFILTMFGYMAWFAAATVRAGGPAALLSSMLGVIANPAPGASYHVSRELFQTLPGITTITQLGILYVTVEALLLVSGEVRRNAALMRLVPVIVLALLRATVMSERLALVEILLPITVVFLSQVRLSYIKSYIVRLAPAIGATIVFALFAVTEYFRSWTYYKSVYPGPYLQFVAERLAGYYATAANNAAVYYQHVPAQPLSHSLAWMFEFPVIGSSLNALYSYLFGTEIASHTNLLTMYANPEFNNLPLSGMLINDFTLFLAPVAAFLAGVVSYSLYQSFVRGRMLGLLLYPSWFVGILEIPRIYYWFAGRYLPVLLFLCISLFLFSFAKSFHKVPPSARPLLRRHPVSTDVKHPRGESGT